MAFAMLELMEFCLIHPSIGVKEHKENPRAMLWSPGGTGRLPGDEVVACINGRLNHLSERVRMGQEARDVLKYCDSDLQKKCQENYEVAKIPIFAICTSLGPGTTPVRAREPTDQNAWSALEEVRPSGDGTYVEKVVGALKVG